MKAHPKLAWSLIAVLLTVIIGFVVRRYININLVWMYLIAINFVGLLFFWYDKRAASREGAGRIPNRVLFGLALLGGSVGALAGIRWFSHKIGRDYLWWRVMVWSSLLAHILLIYCGFVDESGRCQNTWDQLLVQIRAVLIGE